MKLILCVFLLVPCTVFAAGRIDPNSIELSQDMQDTIGRGPLLQHPFLSMISSGFLPTKEKASSSQSSLTSWDVSNAIARAEKMYGYLAADIDWDGNVTRVELEQHLAGQNQGFVQGYRRDGDLDGNGVIQLSEMMEDAGLELPMSREPDRASVREMLNWDLDGNGILEWNEVLDVIAAKQ